MSRRINIKDLYASLAAFRNRLGEVTNDALDKVQEPVACQAGCGYCCNYRIYLRPEEVFMIVDYVRANFTPDRSKVIREQISQNSKTLKKLSRHERLATNLECAFLQDNSCSIYEVRPDMCRVHFSSDVNMCIKSIENPEDQSIVHKVDF